ACRPRGAKSTDTSPRGMTAPAVPQPAAQSNREARTTMPASGPTPSPADRRIPPTSTTTQSPRRIARGASTPTRPEPVRFAAPTAEQHFAAFVARNRRAIRDCVDATLRGTPDSDVDRDAVVQEALLRVWRGWPEWPTADARRQAYLRRALRLAALDALRAVYGRDGRRPRTIATDYTSLEGCNTEPSPAAAELTQTLARQAHSITTSVEDRLVLADALTVLTGLERRAVLLSAHGLTDREV